MLLNNKNRNKFSKKYSFLETTLIDFLNWRMDVVESNNSSLFVTNSVNSSEAAGFLKSFATTASVNRPEKIKLNEFNPILNSKFFMIKSHKPLNKQSLFNNIEAFLRPASFFPQKKKFMQYWIFPFVGFVGLTWNKNLNFPHLISNSPHFSQHSISLTNKSLVKNFKWISVISDENNHINRQKKAKINYLSYAFPCSQVELKLKFKNATDTDTDTDTDNALSSDMTLMSKSISNNVGCQSDTNGPIVNASKLLDPKFIGSNVDKLTANDHIIKSTQDFIAPINSLLENTKQEIFFKELKKFSYKTNLSNYFIMSKAQFEKNIASFNFVSQKVDSPSKENFIKQSKNSEISSLWLRNRPIDLNQPQAYYNDPILEKILFSKSKYRKPQWFELNISSDFSDGLFPLEAVIKNDKFLFWRKPFTMVAEKPQGVEAKVAGYVSDSSAVSSTQDEVKLQPAKTKKKAKKMEPIPFLSFSENNELNCFNFYQTSQLVKEKNLINHKFESNNFFDSYSMKKIQQKKDLFSIKKNEAILNFEKSPLTSYEKAKNLLDHTAKILELKKPFLQKKAIKSINFLMAASKKEIQEDFIKKKQFSSKLLIKFEHFKNGFGLFTPRAKAQLANEKNLNLILNSSLYSPNFTKFNSKKSISLLRNEKNKNFFNTSESIKEIKKSNNLNQLFIKSVTKKLKVDLDKFILRSAARKVQLTSISSNVVNILTHKKNRILNKFHVISDFHSKKFKLLKKGTKLPLISSLKKEKALNFKFLKTGGEIVGNLAAAEYVHGYKPYINRSRDLYLNASSLGIKNFMDELYLFFYWKKTLNLSKDNWNLFKRREKLLNKEIYLLSNQNKKNYNDFFNSQKQPIHLNETFLDKLLKTQNFLVEIASTKKCKNLEFENTERNLSNSVLELTNPILFSCFSLEDFSKPFNIKKYTSHYAASCSVADQQKNLLNCFLLTFSDFKSSYMNLLKWRTTLLKKEYNNIQNIEKSFLIGSFIALKENNSNISYEPSQYTGNFYNGFHNLKNFCLVNSNEFKNRFLFFIKKLSLNFTKEVKTFQPFFVESTFFNLKTKPVFFAHKVQKIKLMKKNKKLNKKTWITNIEKKEKNKKEKIFRTLFSYKSSLNFETNFSLEASTPGTKLASGLLAKPPTPVLANVNRLKEPKLDFWIIRQLKKRVIDNKITKKQNGNKHKLNLDSEDFVGFKNFIFIKPFRNSRGKNRSVSASKKNEKKKDISLNHYLRRIGFLFLASVDWALPRSPEATGSKATTEWHLKNKMFSYPNVEIRNFNSSNKVWQTENSVFQQLTDVNKSEKEKSFQKKRRRKKLKLETRRRKKRKRFYPRPVWLRYSLYKKFLTIRHPFFINLSHKKKSKNIKQAKYFKKNFVNSSFFKNFSNKSNKTTFLKASLPSFEAFKNKKLKQKIYRNNKQNWGNFEKDTPKYEKIALNKELIAIHLPVFQNKEYYKVSPQILSEFQPLCWRSYWLRSNLTPYMNRVQKYFEKMKEIEKSDKVVSSFHSFLSSLLGFHIIDKLVPEDLKFPLSNHPSKLRLQPFKKDMNFKNSTFLQSFADVQNLALSSNFKNSFHHNGFPVTLNNPLFGETYYISEYNRIQFERFSDILKKVKFNMNLEGKNKAKSYKFNAWKFLANKKELKAQNKKQFWYRLSKEIHPNLSSMSIFVALSNIKGDTSLKPYGSSATLRVLWSFNKTNQFTFKERNQIRKLWEKTKLREQLKSNQTKKFFGKVAKFLSPFSLNYYNDNLLLEKPIIKQKNLKKNQIDLMSQINNKQTFLKKRNVSTIEKFQIIQKKQNALTHSNFNITPPQKTQSIFLLNSNFKNKQKNSNLLKTNHPKFYDFYLRKLKFYLKFYSKKDRTEKMKFHFNLKQKDLVQKERLLKSSSIFWWSSRNFKILLKDLNSFNYVDFSKKEINFLFNNFFRTLNPMSIDPNANWLTVNAPVSVDHFETEKRFSVNYMLTFSILFHLSILFSFIRIPELRGLLKFQGLILFKITNNFFIILFFIYELLKKYKKQLIKSFSIFLKLSSLILDPNPVDKKIGFSKNQSVKKLVNKFLDNKFYFFKTNSSFTAKNFVFTAEPETPSLLLIKKKPQNSKFMLANSSIVSSANFFSLVSYYQTATRPVATLLGEAQKPLGTSYPGTSFKDLTSTNNYVQKFKPIASNFVWSKFLSIFDQSFKIKDFQKSKILEWNLNFPKILNKNWILYSFLYNNFLVETLETKFYNLNLKKRASDSDLVFPKEKTQVPPLSLLKKKKKENFIIKKYFTQTPFIYLFETEPLLQFKKAFLKRSFFLLRNKSYSFFSFINIQTKFAFFFLFLTKSMIIFSSNCIQLSYQLILKIIDFFESILLIVYKFLEKPAELMIEWIAQIFLIEWSSDLSTFIPETFDMYFWSSFQKFFRNSRFFGFLEFHKAIFLSNNFNFISNEILKSKAINSFSLLPNNSFTSLLSFQIINMMGFFMQRRLWLFYHFFLDSILKPDIDLIIRQKKGQIFWDVWAEILIKAAEQYQINLPSLTSLKEEQEKLIERLIQDPSFFKKFETFLSKEEKDYIKEPFLKDFHSIKAIENYWNKKNYLTEDKKFDREQNRFSGGLLAKPPEVNFYLNFWNHSYKIKSWSTNQYVTFNLKDTDLFLDLSVPKSFFSVNFINGYEPIQYTLGSIMCEIYSGLFSTKVSKNLLIVNSNLSSSNFLKNLSSSRTSYGNLMIQALAGESEMKMMIDNANRYATIQRGIAVGMKLLKDVFDSIVLQSPCFFLIEEIHVIGERRPMLISDDQNSKAFQSVFGLEQSEESEKNQFIYQLSRHSINDFRRPYKGDFSRLIPTNLYMKNLYSFKKFLAGRGATSANFAASDAFATEQKKDPISIPIIENLLKSEQLMSTDCLTSINNELNTSFVNSRLQMLSEQFFVPPATSPFTILMMKEQTKLKPKRIVKSMGWNSFLADQMNKSKIDPLIRVKVSILADMTLRNFSVKLDMITDLLVIIDSVRSNRGFVVFATTHLPSILDPALRRPGRFDETISLPLLPNLTDRWSLFQMHFNERGDQSKQVMEQKSFSKDTFDRFDYGLFTENFSFPQISSLISKSKLSILNSRFFKSSYHKKFFNKSSTLINGSNLILNPQVIKFHKQKTCLNDVYNFALKKYPIKHPNQTLQSFFVDKDFLETFNKSLKLNKSVSIDYKQNLPIKSYLTCESQLQISSGYFQIGSLLIQMDLLKDQKTFSFYNKSLILDQYSPLAFTALYSSNSEFKKILLKFLGGKMAEFLAISNPILSDNSLLIESNEKKIFNDRNKTTLVSTQNLLSFVTSNSLENKKLINKFEKNKDLINSPFSKIYQPIRYQSWRFSTSWIFSILQKRFLTSNNLIVTKMLSFDNPNQSSLREPPSPPASTLLMPAKKYENFKRVEYDFQQKLGFSIHEKMQMHQKQRFLKKLYNQPVASGLLGAKPEISTEKQLTSFSSCFKEFSFFNSLLLKTSSSHFYYKNRLSMRHRFSLINQWWNGQLAEHNVETTYLSEIDWRSIYIKTAQSSLVAKPSTKIKDRKNLDLNLLLNKSLKENGKNQSIDSILDFPDADQHYNPRTRRWFLHSNSWNYWLAFENTFYYDIYYHYIMEAFNKTSDYFEKNREFLDFMVSKFLQKGFLKEIDLIFLLSRFYRK